MTVTEPPGPDCGPVAEAAIWVLAMPVPSSTSAPGVVTLTEPPAPVPAVVLAISAPELSVICGALTVTDPALPPAVGVAEAMIPLPGSLKRQRPLRGDLHGRRHYPTRPYSKSPRAPPDSAIAPPADQHHVAGLSARPRLGRGGDPARAVGSGAGQAHAIRHSNIDIATLAGPGSGAGDLRPARDV